MDRQVMYADRDRGGIHHVDGNGGVLEPFDQVLAPIAEDRKRVVTPTLVVCGGGVGAGIGRRIKWNLNRFGIRAYVRFVVLDTDEASKESEGAFPGFEDSEFCHLPMAGVRDVLTNPDRHRVLQDRLGLSDPTVRNPLLGIANRNLAQAGQVRPLGLLAYWANHSAVRQKLEQGLADVRELFAELERFQHDAARDVDIRRRLQVVVVGSVAGGTNSSFCLDLVATIRQLLGAADANVKGYYVMPHVLDSLLSGKPDEQRRVKANAYHTLCAISAFDGGFGSRRGIQFGSGAANQVDSPAGFHNSVFLVDRVTEGGTDLGSLEAVQDVIAMHIAADIGSEVGLHLETADNNDVAQQGLALDPTTGAVRKMSTIGAGAVGLPFSQLYRYSVGRELVDFLTTVKGCSPQKSSIASRVQELVRKCGLNDKGQHLCEQLRGAAVAPLRTYQNGVYRRCDGKVRRYFRNQRFVIKMAEIRSRFDDETIRTVQNDVTRLATAHETVCKAKFFESVGDCAVSKGLTSAVAFAEQWVAELESLKKCCDDEKEKAGAEKAERRKDLDLQSRRLRAWVLRWFTSRTKQDEAVLLHQQYMEAATCEMLNGAVSKILGQLIDDARTMLDELKSSLKHIDTLRRWANETVVASTPSGSAVTTASRCEVDVSTREMFEDFLQRNRMNATMIISTLAKKLKWSKATVVQKVHTDSCFPALFRLVERHCQDRVSQETIADLLEHELSASDARRNAAQARLESGLKAAQPMWRTNPGQVHVQFGDTLIVAVPWGDSVPPDQSMNARFPKLRAALTKAANALPKLPRYAANVQIVHGSDPHRIVAARRSHGGCLAYLAQWPQIKATADDWAAKTNVPVAVFPSTIASEIASIGSPRTATPEERAWAVALAFGWVARRGPSYYSNLAKHNGTFVVEIVSEWDGLAFDAMQFNPSASLEAMTNSNKIVYSLANEVRDDHYLGGSLVPSAQEFYQRGNLITMITDAFGALRECAGDRKVASDLRHYVGRLERRFADAGKFESKLPLRQQSEVLYDVLKDLEQ